ncbi:hypothetical protein XIS1_1980001 [Xenorhabdus innexi]|uniref:Uncharacterized protein n=1 Tax=Xenorhabdus innexi TaxID=290109 RepID=A0A1N6MX85_9GAMM|nr:hypothetical protein XIS1_1980001 [Xenorhabdus innexi]
MLTIFIVHTFWNFSGEHAKISLYFAFEHTTVIGGFCWQRQLRAI